jgi:hypothetical protein
MTLSCAVRAVTHMAIRVIAAKAGIGGPIHRAVALNLVGGIALLVVVFPVFAFDRRGITGPVPERQTSADDKGCAG